MNRLANSTSPYLKQHAANPVDWQPWDAAALAQAKAEDKPIFISIGYATCHWCHVMAHESFENEQVAAELNRYCVCIKVDREEMPQIDQLYMRACQLMTGGGGWPLNLALTPDGRPFFAATYIRPNSSFGQLGMLDLPGRFAASWQEHRSEVETRADLITEHLKAAPTGGMNFGPELYAQSSAQLKSAFDRQFGGFGAAPKFPSCHNLLFLLGCFENQGDQAALDMVNQTITAIRNGGIYDQLGYGLHRYATDQAWTVPHFEKMLYDQAMLILTCSEAYRLNQDERCKRAGLDTAAYVLRDLRLENGACATAEDADSEGHEGRFYVWTFEQARQLLNEAELAILTKAFKLTQRGNFSESPGANILAVNGELDDALRAEFEPVRLKLLAARAQRVRPLRDDKILCDLNAMTVVALASAGRSFGSPELQEAAQAIFDWLLTNYKTTDGLNHCAGQPGLLDDWAWLGLACLAMQRPQLAAELADAMLARFREDDRLYLSDQNAPNLIARPYETFDNATPCGNSVAIALLVRLGETEARFKQAANALLAGLNGQLHPSGHGFLL